MAQFFAHHDFLVGKGNSPETDPRELVASILVNSGTTPDIIVKEALEWVKETQSELPPDITWYTIGHTIPVTLRKFREESESHLASSAQLFLFPGKVNHIYEAVSGTKAADFINKLDTKFDYALLSAYGFDIENGQVKFHSEDDYQLQRACATHYAEYKFLFLNPGKFRKVGNTGYTISEMLSSSEITTIYTISSVGDEEIKAKFKMLCKSIFASQNDKSGSTKLRLRIIGVHGVETYRPTHK